MRKLQTLFTEQTDLQQVAQEPPKLKIGKTPIEIALGIDEQGRTTARKLYAFLELNKSNYSKWCKRNIVENDFAEEEIDYYFLPMKSEEVRSSSSTNEKYQPNPTQDYILTATFAKKLAMTSNTEKGEQAREYFIKVEEKLKEIAAGMQKGFPYQEVMEEIRELKELLAKTRNTNNFLVGSVTRARGEDLDNVLLLTDKQAQARYSMSRAGIMKVASECGAVIRYGKRLRIDRNKMDEYLTKEYCD